MTEPREGYVEVHPFMLGALSRAREAGIGIDFSESARKQKIMSTGAFIGMVLAKIENTLDTNITYSPNVEIGLAVLDHTETDAPTSLFTVLGVDDITESHEGVEAGTLAEAIKFGVRIPDLSDIRGGAVMRGYSYRKNDHNVSTYFLGYPKASAVPKSWVGRQVEAKLGAEARAEELVQVSVAEL